jgi:hypothetical protein
VTTSSTPSTSSIAGARTTVFSPRLAAMLRDRIGEDLFRIDHDTIGVADPGIADQILGARRATEVERPTFKPLHGRSIGRPEASSVMHVTSTDVRAALSRPIPEADLAGPWPITGHTYLRDMILAGDPRRLRMLMSRNLELTPKLTWSVIVAGAALPRGGRGRTGLAGLFADAEGYQDRRYAMGIYRRAAAPLCFTVSTLVANAMWLGAPFDAEVGNKNVIMESLRMLPPSWNILRRASPEYPAVDARIGERDDVLILPLLSQRDPALFDDPETFQPERWDHLDPDTAPGFLPFGHVSERCWGRHLVMPLAELLLERIRRDGLVVDPRQRSAKVPLLGLLGVDEVRLVRGRRA